MAFVPADADASLPEQRVAEAAIHVPDGGALTGWASLLLHGGAYFDGVLPDGSRLPVPMVAGRSTGHRTPAGITMSYEPLGLAESTIRHGVPVTEPTRALFDEMRRPEAGRAAVVALDMALAAKLLTVTDVHEMLAARTRWRRSTLVARALPLGSERSRSPNETRLRLMWILDAELPTPFVNRELFDLHGDLVCVPDLFDEEAGVVVEFEGAAHRGATRHARDVAREERCRMLGLEYCKITGPDLWNPKMVVDRLLNVRGRAAFAPPGERSWTLRPPPYWRPL